LLQHDRHVDVHRPVAGSASNCRRSPVGSPEILTIGAALILRGTVSDRISWKRLGPRPFGVTKYGISKGAKLDLFANCSAT
jgi:hypothetical protein